MIRLLSLFDRFRPWELIVLFTLFAIMWALFWAGYATATYNLHFTVTNYQLLTR